MLYQIFFCIHCAHLLKRILPANFLTGSLKPSKLRRWRRPHPLSTLGISQQARSTIYLLAGRAHASSDIAASSGRPAAMGQLFPACTGMSGYSTSDPCWRTAARSERGDATMPRSAAADAAITGP